jgi:hypothetical protein
VASTTVKRARDVTYEVVDGRAMLVDPSGAELITLNPVGTLVWETLADERRLTLDVLIDRIRPQLSDVTREQLAQDLSQFVQELAESGLVELADA